MKTYSLAEVRHNAGIGAFLTLALLFGSFALKVDAAAYILALFLGLWLGAGVIAQGVQEGKITS